MLERQLIEQKVEAERAVEEKRNREKFIEISQWKQDLKVSHLELFSRSH